MIKLWKNGSDQAFEALYKRHVIALLSIAAHKTGDREAAKELVQDSFISLYEHVNQISEDTSIRSYLYVTLKHKLFNHYRKALVHQKYEMHVVYGRSEQDHTTQIALETKELEQQLSDEILKLPPQCRLVFTLSRKEYLTNKQIAEKLGISENTVEQHMRKALRLMRISFGNLLGIVAAIFLVGH